MPAQAETLKVFAAASLSDALDEALEVCRAETGTDAIGVYAGSGTAARQVAQGAPASIYISANPQWMDWLEQRGLIAADTRVDLLGNRLVWVARKDEPRADPHMNQSEFIDWMGERRVAVADIETVPAGIYAKQVFKWFGYWDVPAFRSGLVQASNVREALTWVARGEVAIGVVYLTDVLGEDALEYALIKASLHDPIRYPAAVVRDLDSPKVRGLLACLQGEEASDVFKRFGFDLLP